MQESKKRPFPQPDFDPSQPPKRPRQDTKRDSSSVAKRDSRLSVTPSSPTLIGSVPTSPPCQTLQSSQTDETDSATSSYASSLGIPDNIEETSSSDESSDTSDQTPPLSLQQQRLLAARMYDDSTTTSSSGESFSSTSASISDELSSSSVSTSSGSDEENDDLSPSPSSSPTGSPTLPPPTAASTETLTAKNLSKLQRRLNSLLPRLQSANEQLERDREAGKLGERDIENVEDGDGGEKGYIEMDLGLGVLEEKGHGKAEDDMEQDDSDSQSSLKGKSQQSLKEDAITRLLKKTEGKTKRKVQIEDVDSR